MAEPLLLIFHLPKAELDSQSKVHELIAHPVSLYPFAPPGMPSQLLSMIPLFAIRPGDGNKIGRDPWCFFLPPFRTKKITEPQIARGQLDRPRRCCVRLRHFAALRRAARCVFAQSPLTGGRATHTASLPEGSQESERSRKC